MGTFTDIPAVKAFPDSDVSLRRLGREAVDLGYLEWINDPEINAFLESRFKIWSSDDLVAYIEKVNNSPADFLFGIFVGDRYIGNIKLGPVDEHHGRASIGLMIGDRANHGKGYGEKALSLIKDFAFSDLHLRKLTAGCYAPNQASLRLFLKSGFEIEGTLRGNVVCQGKECDVFLMGCLNPERNVA